MAKIKTKKHSFKVKKHPFKIFGCLMFGGSLGLCYICNLIGESYKE